MDRFGIIGYPVPFNPHYERESDTLTELEVRMELLGNEAERLEHLAVLAEDVEASDQFAEQADVLWRERARISREIDDLENFG